MIDMPSAQRRQQGTERSNNWPKLTQQAAQSGLAARRRHSGLAHKRCPGSGGR